MLFFVRTARLIDMMPKHIFWPIIDCFSMYDTMGAYTQWRFQGVVSRRVGGRGPSSHVTKMAFTPYDPPFPS